MASGPFHQHAQAADGAMSDKLLIIDDDGTFGHLLETVATAQGFAAECRTSLVDLGTFARIKEFDVAIVDFYLGNIRGDEIAEYVESFFGHIPVVIASGRDFRAEEVASWPGAVRQFVAKSAGADAIVAAAREVLDRARGRHRGADPTPPRPEHP
jgi:DNA-binding response OmpR family regulator